MNWLNPSSWSAFQEMVGSIISWIISIGIIGGLLELIKWLRELRRQAAEDRARKQLDEFRSYSRLHSIHIRFLELIIEYPHLGIYESQEDKHELSADDVIRRQVMYDIFLSMLEAAYLDYRLQPDVMLSRWPAWEAYLDSFLRKRSFLEHWNTGVTLLNGTFGLDAHFEVFMKEKVQQALGRVTQ